MEDVDLGKDRTQLIDFVYANGNGNGSASNLNQRNNGSSNNIPLSEKAVKQPLQSQPQSPPPPKPQKQKSPAKPKKKIACAPGSAICLFLLAVAAIIFAAFLGHYLTKQNYEMMQFKNSNESMVVCKNYTRPHKKTHRPIVNEEDADENDAIKQPTKEELALPKSVQPVWYDVSLSPKTGGNGTMGLALVKLNITEPTNKIVLNAKGIEFTKNLEKIQLSKEATKRSKKSAEEISANVTNSKSEMPEGSGMRPEEESVPSTTTTTEATPVSSLVDTGIKITGIEFNEDLEQVVLTLDQELKKGSEVVLKIPFTSKVTNSNGLKEYKYKTPNGEERSMFTTQPSYAYMRHVFPSFDQESFKAPAALTLMHSNGSVVVANTEVKTEDDGDSLTSTLKKVLDPDFVIGDLVANEVNTTSGLTIRIWTRPEVQHYTEQALDYANQAIDALEHILQSRLESKTLDIVAVPGFQPGNRVSPSFIVLPEEDVLYNEHSNNINQKAHLARVLSNRIAAQWFGGITNPEEFGTFWLNDALPKFIEVEALEKILDVKSDDLWTYELEKIFERDATATSQPLRVKNVFSATDIAAIDHEFIGKKGAAVLRMIQKSVGETAFNKAIRSFVSSYRSAYPYDDGLWKSFQKAIGQKLKGWNNEPLDVAKFVNTWVDQIGFPLVSVDKLDDENVELSQERFKNDHKTKEQFKFRNAKYWFNWEVPLFLKSSGPVGNVSWLHEAFRLPLNTSDSIYLNTDSNGVYRVNYEEIRWNEIAKYLEKSHGKLSERTRARLISDVFALANSGALPFETALNVTSYLPMETGTVPWLIASRIFKKLTQRLEGAPIQEKLNNYIYEKIHKEFDKVNTSPDIDSNYLESLLHSNLLDLMAIVKPAKSNEKLNQIFVESFLAPCQFSGNFSSDCSEVPGELREKVYCNGVEFGNDTVFETVKELAAKEVDETEKVILQNSLACFRDPRVLRRMILENLNSTTDAIQLLKKMNSRPVGREIATNWIIDNWSTILKKKFKNDSETLNAIADAGIVLNNEREKSTIETFMEHHRKSTNGIESLDRKIEEATTDIYWRKQRVMELNDYLDGKMKGPTKEEEEGDSEEQE